jgi:ABC-type antimicrobial peptide transport system permease subunit
LFPSCAATLVAFLAARAISPPLFGVPPEDPMTILLVAALCFVTTVVACARPALRAAAIQPMAALRAD